VEISAGFNLSFLGDTFRRFSWFSLDKTLPGGGMESDNAEALQSPRIRQKTLGVHYFLCIIIFSAFLEPDVERCQKAFDREGGVFHVSESLEPFKYLLFGGFNPSEKYESQIGSSSQLLGKIKFMFQTTNQISSLVTGKFL